MDKAELKNKLLKPYGELWDIREKVTDEAFKSEISRVISQLSYCIGLCEDSLQGVPVKNSKKIASAVDGGWEVTSGDAHKALDMWVEYVGEDNALEDIAQAQGTDSLLGNIDYIAQQFDVAEEVDTYSDIWDKHNKLRSLIGVHDYFTNLSLAMGYDELAECMAFIFRQNDFRQWEDDNGIYNSKKLKNTANLHKLYS